MIEYTSPVELVKVKLETWTDRRTGEKREARMLTVKEPRGQHRLPLHTALNGELPEMGSVVGLVIHAYEFRTPRISKAGDAYDHYETKRRVVGFHEGDVPQSVVAPASIRDEYLTAA